ncbi:MAG: hypothetical protein HY298_21900 [Verrucomicrobia bacterium]|nr:hypothetical protein [Verrucomicrobiota bacterium]
MQPSQPPNPIPEDSKVAAMFREQRENATKLLHNIKQQLPQLEEMLAHVEGHWCMEDGFYRFYHQSFKVYRLQELTEGICKALQALLPDRPMNRWFTEIVEQGTGHEIEMSHNRDWLRHTRPIVEAFFHAHYFLKLAVKYGKELETAPDVMPSGWATVLYLFDLR